MDKLVRKKIKKKQKSWKICCFFGKSQNENKNADSEGNPY